MSDYSSLLETILPVVLVPALTYHWMRWANERLKKVFPVGEKYLLELKNLAETQEQKGLKKYLFVESFLFLIFFSAFGYFYATWPVKKILSMYPRAIDIEPDWVFVLYCISLIVVIPHAANIANLLIRIPFSIFNHEKDSIILFFASRIMNPTHSGYRVSFNLIDANYILTGIFTAFWAILLVFNLNHHRVICADCLAIKSGFSLPPAYHAFKDCNVILESKSEKKVDGVKKYDCYIFKIMLEESEILRTVRCDRFGSTDARVVEALKKWVK
ncbi:MAG: hypothetical protein AB1403_19240 [Candidatus Riflebacteria bacterium]